MPKFLGRADVVVDGETLLSGDDTTLDPGGFKRDPVKGSKVFGYREEIMEAVLEVNVAIGADYSSDRLNAITNATINFVADTVQTWVMRSAFSADPGKINQKDGKAKHVFKSPPAEEAS